MCVNGYTHTHTYLYVYVYIYIYVHTHIYMYIYMYIYIYMHGFCGGTQRWGARAPSLMMVQQMNNINLKLAKDK